MNGKADVEGIIEFVGEYKRPKSPLLWTVEEVIPPSAPLAAPLITAVPYDERLAIIYCRHLRWRPVPIEASEVRAVLPPALACLLKGRGVAVAEELDAAAEDLPAYSTHEGGFTCRFLEGAVAYVKREGAIGCSCGQYMRSRREAMCKHMLSALFHYARLGCAFRSPVDGAILKAGIRKAMEWDVQHAPISGFHWPMTSQVLYLILRYIMPDAGWKIER